MGCTSKRVRFLCLGATETGTKEKSITQIASLIIGMPPIIMLFQLPTSIDAAETSRPADAAEASFFAQGKVIGLVLTFFPSLFNTPPRRGGLQKYPQKRIFLEPRFAPSTSSAQMIGICLSAAMRSAGASLWRLTMPPFLPRMGDSFFRKERSKEHTESTGAILYAGRDWRPTRLRRR